MGKSKNQNILDIIQGISQVLVNKYDGARADDGKGDLIKIGLNREVDNIMNDSRLMDGYNCRIQGEFLIVTYHTQILMTDIHDKKFEKDIDGIFSDIIKFIKKEYKAFTKETLGLKEQGKVQIKVETMSRIRSWAIAQKVYKIAKVDTIELGDNKKLDKAIENWLSLKTDKEPRNVFTKKGANDKEEK